MSKNNKFNQSNFILCGKNLIFESIKAGRTPKKIFVYKELDKRGREDLRVLALDSGIKIEYCEREELLKLSGTPKNQGMVAFLEDFKTLSLSEAFDHLTKVSSPKLVVILDSINDPQNLGSIIRTSAVAGVNLLIINGVGSCPLSSAVFKVSQGGVFYLPICIVVNLNNVLRRLKENSFWIYGFETVGANLYYDIKLLGDVALVFGGEGTGLRELTKKSSDFLLKIPIKGDISSLNVSIAAALGIFEVLRQRDKPK